MRKKIFIGIIGMMACAFIVNMVYAAVPQGASIVKVEGNRLKVQKRLSDGSLDSRAAPYIIKGVTWSPATRAPANGPNPLNPTQSIQYGFFFDWTGRNPQGNVVFNYWLKTSFPEHYQADLALMKQMNINTVRIYTDLYNDIGIPAQEYTQVLDECYNKGIMVIMTVVYSKADIDSARFLTVVNKFKNHPAILMWALGNEWNLAYNLYYGYASVSEAAAATNNAAAQIKAADPNHPVSSSLGDRFTDANPANTIAAVISACGNVDVWGINIYRGQSFGDLFTQWKGITSKPFYLSEFGTDSFRTTTYRLVSGYQADDCIGSEDQQTQKLTDLNLWNEIKNHLSLIYSDGNCIGGFIHEFNDELWKVGSYHVGLGGLVDYNGADNIDGTADDDTSYDEYNLEGFYLAGGHPDNVANEEYFGVVNADRNPKAVFSELQNYYKDLIPVYFDDVPYTYWAFKEIGACFEARIVRGYSDNPPTYGPEILVSRDQMAVYIQRAKGLPLYTGPQIFSDVPTTHWAFGQIGACYQAGIVQGYSATEYRPELIVTRDQMAVYIQRAKGLTLYTGPQIFSDVPPTHWAFGQIGACYQAGIVQGYSATEYRPNEPVTRAQMAVYIYRAFLRDNPSYTYKAAVVTENIPPILNPIGNKTINEGSLLQFAISATDVNRDSLTYSATGLPSGATFSAQTFKWTPSYTQAGTYKVTFTVKDARGDTDYETITITINNLNRSPSVGSIAPSSGSSYANQAVNFATTYSDSDGWQNIQYVHLLVNTAVSGTNCFYGYYNQNTNKLYLRNDANTGWLGGYAPGSSYTIENSYAKLNCALTTISGSSNSLSVKWNITFKSTFKGTKNTYLYVKDDSNAANGWIQKGTWTIR